MSEFLLLLRKTRISGVLRACDHFIEWLLHGISSPHARDVGPGLQGFVSAGFQNFINFIGIVEGLATAGLEPHRSEEKNERHNIHTGDTHPNTRSERSRETWALRQLQA